MIKDSLSESPSNSSDEAKHHDEGQLASSEELLEVFHSTFSPRQQEEIVYAFGYGSGVFAQTDSSKNDEAEQSATEQKMLDMIIIVQDALQFHSINIEENPHHYAPLFRTPSRAAWWQTHQAPFPWLLSNPKVFFNFCQDPLLLKYGIMERQHLCSDLQFWDSLYIAGRMQKPTATILQSSSSSDDGLMMLQDYQNRYNLPAALSTALLLLGRQDDTDATTEIPLSALYSQISSLSYTGDFRMQVGAEDPAKIDKLVHSPGQLQRFHQMYHATALQPLVESGVVSLETNSNIGDTAAAAAATTITWNPQDPSTIAELRQRLPPRLARHLEPKSQSSSSHATTTTTTRLLQNELHSIVAPAARYQAFKGLWTAGITKSASYALAKLSKGLLRSWR
ncbi:Phosphatidate cytidylyltransferase, mitochondrial [Seminavis robusta]|uniref:Phosphatidate cytidylyltransferase, mitochondrial n=1 Tax=Seminavis robusta TaxID=568900 RepID=A0A9N8DXT9_9STRA|nr:Phosphatidate cytidylyltransferase, mitochondrial [Seminavis robusta]|eukprot:Sro452_g145850.1 Phosphatidate cytidylyltransferase, mitochondrial (394) ;mRNA; f:15716-16897